MSAPEPFIQPVPPDRGRWRLTLHQRKYGTPPLTWDHSVLVELVSARSRILTRQWCMPAELRFTLDGHDPECAAISELQHEVIAWRWDETAGADVCMFRGVIDHSEDQISEQVHTVNFVAHDYLAQLGRRFTWLSSPSVYTNVDQDTLAATLLNWAVTGPFLPGSQLPLKCATVNPDGTSRALSGQARTRTYTNGAVLGTLFDQLAKVNGGFDYDVSPEPVAPDNLATVDNNGTVGTLGAGWDGLRLFYPSQGVSRTDLLYLYGSNVSAITRTVNSADYANHVMSVGNNQSASAATAPFMSNKNNPDAYGQTVGYWPLLDTAPNDVTVQATLDDRAQGLVNVHGVLLPSYTLSLYPTTYSYGNPNIGDTVPLVVQSGRLNVNTTIRVMALTWTIGDDGQEDVALVVGTPKTSLWDLFARQETAVNALTRR